MDAKVLMSTTKRHRKCILKGTVHPKYKFCHHLLTLQFCTALFLLWNTKDDILKMFNHFCSYNESLWEQNNAEPHFLHSTEESKKRFRMTSWLYWLCMIIWLAFSIVYFTLLSKIGHKLPSWEPKTQSSLLESRIGCVNEQFKSVISQNPKSSVSLICFVTKKWSKKEHFKLIWCTIHPLPNVYPMLWVCLLVCSRRKSAGVLLHRDSSWSVKKEALKVTLVSSPLTQGDHCFSLLSALSIVSTV